MKYLDNVVTLELDTEICTGCGKCLDVCPRQVFSRWERTVTITNKDACIECGACQRNCAFGAVTVTAGVGCAQALFNALLTGGDPVCGCDNGNGGSGSCC